MKVFVTGAAGFIGKAVTANLIAHGHTVLGLARSDANTEVLKQLGAEVQRGDLTDLASLKAGAAQSDATIHLAFHHDFSDFPTALRMDLEAITAIGEAIEGTGKALIIASGTLILPKNTGKAETEDATAHDDGSVFSQRAKSAEAVYEMAKNKGIRGIVVRLPPTVHGDGDKGMIPTFTGMCKAQGKLILIGEGATRWPAAHRDDTAELFRLAVEKGTAGATYHAVAEEGVTMADIFGAVSKKTGLPLESMNMPQAMQTIGPLAHLLEADNWVSSEKTQKELGWKPSHLALLEDLRKNYF